MCIRDRARHALGIGFQHANAAVKGQADVDPAEDAAQQDVNFQQMAEQQIRRTGEDQQRGDIPEQMFAQPQLILDKAIANLRKQRGNRQHGVDAVSYTHLSYSKAQWADFFGMYKKLIDSHVMPDTRYYASFGKSNMYEMKPWIQGEWGGTYMWNSTINKYSDNLKPPAKLVLGEYPMLPGATDAGLFFKPAQMLSIGLSLIHI